MHRILCGRPFALQTGAQDGPRNHHLKHPGLLMEHIHAQYSLWTPIRSTNRGTGRTQEPPFEAPWTSHGAYTRTVFSVDAHSLYNWGTGRTQEPAFEAPLASHGTYTRTVFSVDAHSLYKSGHRTDPGTTI